MGQAIHPDGGLIVARFTPEAYAETLEIIGWSVRSLATRLGVHETRTRRWGTGQTVMPPEVWAWLQALAEAHRKLPLPHGWQS